MATRAQAPPGRFRTPWALVIRDGIKVEIDCDLDVTIPGGVRREEAVERDEQNFVVVACGH
eukprot:2069448-Pyramimonas_sp.AAC.1